MNPDFPILAPPHRTWRSWRATGLALAGGALLGAAGCLTVGPDYRAPASRTPPAWAGGGDGFTPPSQISTQAVALVRWWTLFRDEQLNTLVARALATNLDLRIAASRVRQARAQVAVVAGGRWPAVNASGQYQRQKSSAASGAADLYQAGLDAAWEVDLFGGIRRTLEAAGADYRASVENQRATQVSLAAEVALNYLNLRSLQQQTVIARETLVAQERSADYARKRFRGGFASKLDVANADAAVALTRSQIPSLEAAARQTIYALGVLLAREPAALLSELSAPAPQPLTPPDVPVGLPADLLRRRPDVRQAEAQLHAATARIGVATADLFPKIRLTGAVGTSGNNPGALVQWDNRFYSVGPSVSWSLFAAGSIRANIRVQNELQQQALLAYEKTVLTVLADVESALVAYVKEQQHRQALTEAVAFNQEAVRLATQLYTAGETDFLNVLTAQRSLYSTQEALAQSVSNVALDLVAIYKALGGGWELPAPTSP